MPPTDPRPTLVIESPLGPLELLGADALGQIRLPHQVAPGARRGGPAPALLVEAARQLDEYFAGGRTTFDLPLDPRGTPFRLQVWRALADVDYGTTVSYAELARRVGRPRACRAVGQANGANPLPIVVPCHRVVASGGGMGGYAGGLAAKRLLLDLERAAVA